MTRKLIGALAVWVVAAGAVLAAADFWEEQDFTTWSEEDIVEMMGDSPWAQQVDVRTGKLTARKAREHGGQNNSNRGVRAGAGGGCDYGQGPGALQSTLSRGIQREDLPERMALVVAWRSALPFKQAVVRRAMAEDGLDGDARIPEEQQSFLDQGEDYYVVSVSGFPARSGSWFRKDALMASTSIVRKNKRPLYPQNLEVFLYEGSLSMLLYFSKDDPITLADKEVEFKSTVVDIEVKRKFKMKDMVFAGELVL